MNSGCWVLHTYYIVYINFNIYINSNISGQTVLSLWIFNDVLSIAEITYHRMWWEDDDEWRTTKVLEGRRCGLYQGTILVFNWRDQRKTTKTLVRRTNNMTHQNVYGYQGPPKYKSRELPVHQFTWSEHCRCYMFHFLNLWWKRLNMVCKNLQ